MFIESLSIVYQSLLSISLWIVLDTHLLYLIKHKSFFKLIYSSIITIEQWFNRSFSYFLIYSNICQYFPQFLYSRLFFFSFSLLNLQLYFLFFSLRNSLSIYHLIVPPHRQSCIRAPQRMSIIRRIKADRIR